MHRIGKHLQINTRKWNIKTKTLETNYLGWGGFQEDVSMCLTMELGCDQVPGRRKGVLVEI